MRRMLVSRSSLEKPRPLLRFVRTSSPSSTSMLTPRARSCGTSALVSVVLPAPDNPVNHNVNPCDTNLFPLVILEAAAGIEPANKGFADLRLTTWLRRLVSTPAENQPRINEERDGRTGKYLRRLRVLVVDFHGYSPLSSSRAQPAQSLDQDLRDFGPREFHRRNFALRQHLAHARPAQADMVRLIVRTGLARSHPVALAAEEGVVKKHRRDLQFAGLERAEDELRVVGAVIIAHARVIAPDDEVRAAVVLPDDRVEDRLARPGVAHRRGQHRELRSRLRVIVL